MIRFCYNPTSWRDDAPVPGGMADALVQPILPHLTSPYEFADTPEAGRVNVYYAHRAKYANKHPRREFGVFVSHGIADKRWRDGARLRGQFGAVFTSGPAWTEKTRRTRYPGPIYEVGYTKLDPIFQRKIRPLRRKNGKVRVVWAPTHGGGGELGHLRPAQAANGGKYNPMSTWGRVGEVLDRLLSSSEFDVVAAPHPRHRFNPEVRAELLDMGVTLSAGMVTLDEYVGADVVIADGGSTIYEAWALDIPVVFPDWLTAAANISRYTRIGGSFEAKLYREMVGRHVADPADLAGHVLDAAADGITEAEQAFIEPIFPRAYRGISGRLHAEALGTIYAEF